jgi:hypothetical protein
MKEVTVIENHSAWVKGLPQAPGWYWFQSSPGHEFIGLVQPNHSGTNVVTLVGRSEPKSFKNFGYVKCHCPIEKPTKTFNDTFTESKWSEGYDNSLTRFINGNFYVIYWSRPGVVRYIRKNLNMDGAYSISTSYHNYKDFNSAKRAIRKLESKQNK